MSVPSITTTILSISQLNHSAKQLLENRFANIWLVGEVSNFVRPASNHWYFTLKDNNAQVRAAMFRGNNRNCQILPKNGMQVIVQARLSLYEPRGDYQLIVEQLEEAGDGLLKQQYEQLKNQLDAEGLFAQQHKKPLPRSIHKVGIITSATGAAIRDIISVLQRRAPQLEVIIYPSSVQGDEAVPQLIRMLTLAQQRNEVDVIILGRGGGSLEDLWCFNHQDLAHAIYDCHLPIVSAVGHEIDITICDFVADLRAATPSAAAELVSPDTQAMNKQIDYYHKALNQAIMTCINTCQQKAQLLEQKLLLLHPQNVLNQHAQKLDEYQLKLTNLIQQQFHYRQQHLDHLQHRFKLSQSKLNLLHKHSQCDHLFSRLKQLMQLKLQQDKQAIATLTNALDIISPLATLSRGYSITLNDQQHVIQSSKDVKSGDILNTRVHDGVIKSQVL